LIGLSPGKAEAAIGAAVPAILAGLVGVAQQPEGRARLAALVQGQDTGILDNVTGALSDGREQSLIDSGKGVLSSLFGQGNLDGLAGALGRSTGLDRSSAGSLLGALTPVVLGALGREQAIARPRCAGLGQDAERPEGQHRPCPSGPRSDISVVSVSGPTRQCASWSGRMVGPESDLGEPGGIIPRLGGSSSRPRRRAPIKMEARQRIGAVGSEIASETLYAIRIAAVQFPERGEVGFERFGSRLVQRLKGPDDIHSSSSSRLKLARRIPLGNGWNSGPAGTAVGLISFLQLRHQPRC
jgi:hypothetical protein